MSSIRLGGLFAIATALALVAFPVGQARAQTMGEYATTVGDAATVGASASTLPPPAVHPNPIGNTSSTSAVVEVGNHETREDDSTNYRDDRDSNDANTGDEWSQSR
jgi:hypothetical protein